ncbi:putative hydrolase of the HAD superfamily [uncultured Gammaproteobacteria bacterium]
MGEFIADRFELPYDEARRCQKRLFRTHGTTLRGLMVEYGVNPVSFLDYVHAINLSVLSPDARMAKALAALPGRKLVYTNASTAHARAVLDRIGLADQIELIHDITAADFLPKPDPRPYQALIQRHEIDPTRACMVEDMAANLIPAHTLGMATVWVRSASRWGQPDPDMLPYIDHTTDDLAGWLGSLAERG